MTTVIDGGAYVSKLADLEESSRGTTLTILAGAYIDSFVKVKMAGGTGNIHIGRRSYINSGCVLYCGNGIHIGNDVLIAANCTLAPTNHEFSDSTRAIREQGFGSSKGGIIIEDDVWVGAGSVLLDGAIIRKGAIVGASSLVRTEVESFSIVGGNPLKTLGSRK
jgi:virginiamycin A acetyltransferase